jgi:hypothetical protein
MVGCFVADWDNPHTLAFLTKKQKKADSLLSPDLLVMDLVGYVVK